jgi:hypothetical protein
MWCCKYYVLGPYPSSCLYLETSSCLFFRTQHFGDWILSPSSGNTYSVGPVSETLFWKINRRVFLDKDRTMDKVQKCNICINVPSSQTFRSYLHVMLPLRRLKHVIWTVRQGNGLWQCDNSHTASKYSAESSINKTVNAHEVKNWCNRMLKYNIAFKSLYI